MKSRWLMLFVLCCTLLAPFTASAEIVTVDFPSFDGQNPRPPLLSEAEVQRISDLQRLNQAFIVSPISPDDTTVVQVSFTPEFEIVFSFLNIQDGSITALADQLINYPAATNFVWRDAATLTYVGFDLDFNLAVIDLNRFTGEVVTSPIDPIPGFPLSLAPTGTRLLIGITSDFITATEAISETDEPELARIAYATHLMQSPFDTKLMLYPQMPDTLPPYVQRLIALNQQPVRPLDTIELASDEILLAHFDLNTRTTQHLVRLPLATTLLSNFTWSQDGSRLAFSRLTFKGIEDIFRGGTSLATALVQDGLGILPPAENPLLNGNAVEVFDFSRAEARVSRLEAVNTGNLYTGLSWSPDNAMLLTWMQEPARLNGRTHPVYLYPQRGFARLHNADLVPIGDVMIPALSAPNAMQASFVSPTEIVFNGISGLSTGLFYYNLGSGEFRQISDRDGFYSNVLSTRQSRQLIFSYSSFTTPPDLFRINWDGTAFAQLSFANAALAELNQVQVNRLSFTLANGAVRQAYLLQPAGAAFPPSNAPIVVWQEGGPGLFMTNAWSTRVESPYLLLPNFGISVLVMPLSGREGWGPEFYNALANDFGRVDIDEAAEVVQQMIALGYTASDRIGITGCSYGGYFTSQSIVRYPTLYAAANTQCSLLDLLVEWQTGFSWFMAYLTGVSPTTQAAALMAISPLYQSANTRTPTLIFHGSFDFLPVSITENFHEGIAATGTPVRMLRFAGEGHGLFLTDNQLLAAQEQILWFRQYLAGTP